MSRLAFSLRLLSPYLGNHNEGPTKPLSILRPKDRPEAMLVDIPMWNWAWYEALREEAKPDVYRAAVRMDMLIPAPVTGLYERNLRRSGESGHRTRCHESIRKGVIITFGASVVPVDPTEPPSMRGLRIPTPEELMKALSRIGNTYGISPFGARYGYGRFEIKHFEINGRGYETPVERTQSDHHAGHGGGETAAETDAKGNVEGRGSALDFDDQEKYVPVVHRGDAGGDAAT